jgi:hypothetical protein
MAEALKAEGNKAFAAKNFEEAASVYLTLSITWIPSSLTYLLL